MADRSIKRILMDFDNNFLVYEFTDRGNLFKFQEIDKLAVINTFPVSDAEIYMELCKAGMFGIEFLKEELVIYNSNCNPDMCNKMILKEKKRLGCPGLYDCKKKILDILGYLDNQ